MNTIILNNNLSSPENNYASDAHMIEDEKQDEQQIN